MSISVFCSGCNKTYRVRDELAGKCGKCPQGHVLLVPPTEAVAAAPPQPGPARPVKSAVPLPPSPRKGPARKKCPSCGAALAKSGILCVECGFNLRTGKRVSAAGVPGAGRRKVVLFAGVGAGVFIAASIALIVALSGGPPQTSKDPSSDPAHAEAAQLKAEQEKEAARQVEAARLKAEQEKEAARQVEAARLKAEQEKEAARQA